MKKVIIIGATGSLAMDLVPIFKKQDLDIRLFDLIETDSIRPLDITKESDVRHLIDLEKPSVVLNLSALTDLEYCEKNPEHAFKVNAEGAGIIAKACESIGAKLVHISTGGVFDGVAGNYTEKSLPNPVNVYSKTKLEGEYLVTSHSPCSLILRAGWLSSGGRQDKKFIGKIIERISQGANEISAVNDTVGCPTFSFDFTNQCLELIKLNKSGLYHVCNDGFATRYDIAKEIITIMNVDVSLTIADSEQFKHLYFAKRPVKETIICQRLIDEGIYLLPQWKTSLKKYVARITNNEH